MVKGGLIGYGLDWVLLIPFFLTDQSNIAGFFWFFNLLHTYA